MSLLKRMSGKNGSSQAIAPVFQPLAKLHEQIDQLFDRAWRSFGSGESIASIDIQAWPAVDVSEDEKAVTLRADLPGLEAKDLDVEVSGNVLTIRGSREEEKREEKRGYQYHERRSGSFSRAVSLPAYVDAGRVDARYEKGVLTVTVPKVPGKEPKRITVKSA
jgi:HSP20 family protein